MKCEIDLMQIDDDDYIRLNSLNPEMRKYTNKYKKKKINKSNLQYKKKPIKTKKKRKTEKYKIKKHLIQLFFFFAVDG